MSARESRARAARIVVFLGIVCAGVGGCGVASGVTLVRAAPIPAGPNLPEGEPTEEEAQEAMNRVFEQTRVRAPYSRTLAGANAVVSALLLFGGVLLLMRRSGAVWWVTQGAFANAVWVVAFGVSHTIELLASRGELAMVMTAWFEAAKRNDPDAVAIPALGEHLVWLPIGLEIVGALVKVGIFAWLAWRIRRPDVSAILDEAERERM